MAPEVLLGTSDERGDVHALGAIVRAWQAQSAIDALWTRLELEFGNTRNSPGKGWSSRLVPLLDEQLGYYRPALMVLFGAVALLLGIAVLNVASLLLTRALSRDREFAVRIALGVSPRLLVRQLLSESLVLSIAGAGVGVAAAAGAMPLIVRMMPVAIPRLRSSPDVIATAAPRAIEPTVSGNAFRIRPYCATVCRSADPTSLAVVGGSRFAATCPTPGTGACPVPVPYLAPVVGWTSRMAWATAMPPCPSRAAWWTLE